MMNLLMDDLLQDIFSRLPVRSIMQCRCVCRSWRDLICGSFFTRNQMTRSIAAKSGLMLHTTIYYEGICFFSEFFFMDRHHVPVPTCLPMNFSILNFREFYVRGSCNGLLCLVNRADKFIRFVCNPFLRHCVKIPDNLAYPSGRVNSLVCELGFCPKTQSYKILEISKWTVVVGRSQTEDRLEIHVYRLGDDFWKRIDCKVHPWQPQRTAENPGSASLVNGVFHWVNQSSAAFVTVFDLANDVFDKMPGPKAGTGRFSTGVLGNCLSIMNNHINVDVWVMKQYGVIDSWAKLFVIKITEPKWSVELVRVLDYQQEDGQLLLFYNHQVLGTYDPQKMTFKRIDIVGKNAWYDVVLHSDTLVSPLDFSPKYKLV
ncbi:F-box protein At3g07870-like [Impatiens glandulifera]|uniref:F-box protein At3g07870-like n=1 Tax=Impatiens glandulifera TaxID=253017 RepID=UPI001FB13454|nr:F-box protein At3g07870-like [Impatiens glandulifera]